MPTPKTVQPIKPKIPWKILIGAISIYFALNSVVAYRSTQIMQKNAVKLDNTLQIISVIKELRAQIYAAESGHKGYLITSESDYLEPYHTAQDQISQLLNQLDSVTSASPEQQNHIKQLNDLVAEKLWEMSQIILHVDQAESQRAIRIINTDKGLKRSREIMTLIAKMEEIESDYLEQIRFKADQQSFLMASTLLITNLLGLVLTGIIFYITLLHHRKTETMKQALEEINQNLEQKVSERTAALSRYSEELERSNKELEDFAFVASHDLQEPLRKIRAFGDRLLTRCGESVGEQGADYIRRMQAASERMSLLIDDLLSFSRVTTKQKPLVKTDLNAVIDSVVDSLEIAIENSQARIETDSLPVIEADESQLRQVFSNLLSNSIKFMQEGKPPHIRVTAETVSNPPDRREWVCIKVVDNGIGFDQQYQERIFNLFQRLHGKDSYVGTGIGLALCKKIIERHGGSISAQSIEGSGSTFTILLPITQDS